MTAILKVKVANENNGKRWGIELSGEVVGQYEAAAVNGCFEINGKNATHVLLYGENDADMVASVIELVDTFAKSEGHYYCTNLEDDTLAAGAKFMVLNPNISESVSAVEAFMGQRTGEPLQKDDVCGIAVAVDTEGASEEQLLAISSSEEAATVILAQTQLRSKKPLLLVPLCGQDGADWAINDGPFEELLPYRKTRNSNVRVNFRNLDGAARKLHVLLFNAATLTTLDEHVGGGDMLAVTVELDNVVLCEHHVRNSFFEYGGEMRNESEQYADTRGMQSGAFFAAIQGQTFLYPVEGVDYDGYVGVESAELVQEFAFAAVDNEDGSEVYVYPYPVAPDNVLTSEQVSGQLIYVQCFHRTNEVLFIGEAVVSDEG